MWGENSDCRDRSGEKEIQFAVREEYSQNITDLGYVER